MLSPRQQQGHSWEKFASAWLQQRGLRPVQRNFRCKAGEIDLIMHDGNCLVFVEVKYRADRRRGGPLASVTATKQHRLARAARYFLRRHPEWRHAPLRFDVLGICGPINATEVSWEQAAIWPADTGDNWS